MKTHAIVVSLLTVTSLPLAAQAEDRRQAPATPFVPRVPEVTFAVGVRAMGIPSKGYEAYSENHLLLQSSFSFGLTVLRRGAFSAGAGLEWDAGGKSTLTRGQDAHLFTHRLAIPLEARWEPHRRVALFVKIAAGADRLLVSYGPSSQVARNWAFGLDATAGAALMLGRVKRTRFWLTAEAGYAFAFPVSMNLVRQPGDDEAPRRYGSTELPDLQLGGGLGKLGAAVSF